MNTSMKKCVAVIGLASFLITGGAMAHGRHWHRHGGGHRNHGWHRHWQHRGWRVGPRAAFAIAATAITTAAIVHASRPRVIVEHDRPYRVKHCTIYPNGARTCTITYN